MSSRSTSDSSPSGSHISTNFLPGAVAASVVLPAPALPHNSSAMRMSRADGASIGTPISLNGDATTSFILIVSIVRLNDLIDAPVQCSDQLKHIVQRLLQVVLF